MTTPQLKVSGEELPPTVTPLGAAAPVSEPAGNNAETSAAVVHEPTADIRGALASASRQNILLAGWPPVQEYLGFIQQAGVSDLGPAMTSWRSAADRVAALSITEAGICDGITISPLPEGMAGVADTALKDPVVQRSFSLLPAQMGMVDLDRLVVFQRHIDLAFVDRLKAKLPPGDDEALARFCLLDQSRPPVRHIRQGEAWTFSARSTDLRVVEPVVIRADDVDGLELAGRAEFIVGLAIGYGSNMLNVVKFGNRYVLANGSHHAFALRDSGVTEAPALIQTAVRPDDLMVVPLVQQNMALYMSPRPPLLKDYFDPELRTLVDVPVRYPQLTVGFQVTQGASPCVT